MKTARPRLVEPGAFASQERAELALAIAERNAAAEAQARLVGAQERVHEGVYAANRDVERLTAAADRAQADAVAHALARATGSAGEAPPTVQEARAALSAAQDGLAIARGARDGLVAAIDEAARVLEQAMRRVEVAARAVVASEACRAAQAAVAEVEQLQNALVMSGGRLLWLSRSGALPVIENHGPMFGQVRDDRTRAAISRLSSPPDQWRELLAQNDGAAAWIAAFEALLVDAATPLPSPAAP